MIAVVLLIMITIVAAGIIVGVVVPFVREGLEGSGQCFDVLGDLSFAETPYNCYDADNDSTGFSVKIDNEEIAGFRVSLFEAGTGSADSYDIEQGTSGTVFGMLGDDDVGGDLEVPKKGGVRTYVLYGHFERIELFPILESGAKCDMSDSVNINSCIDVDLGLPTLQ